MERKTIFLALFSVFVACFFAACSNDSYTLDINAIDVKAGTRSVGLSSYMTREEIQDRLDEIGEKYGTRVIIDKGVNIDLISEDVFTKLEEHLSSKQELSGNRLNSRAFAAGENNNDSLFMNDSSIDDIMLMAAPPSGETIVYTGSFDITISYMCVNQQNIEEDVVTNITISWTTKSPNVNTLALSARIDTGHGNTVEISSSNPKGALNSPSFDYSGTIKCHNTVLICDTIFKKDDLLLGQNYDKVINGDSARFEYRYDDVSIAHKFSGNKYGNAN